MKTAMQELFDNLEAIDITIPIGVKEIFFEKEKQQIKDAYRDGRSDQQSQRPSRFYNRNAEQYYNETYRSKGSDEPNGKKVLSALKDLRDSFTDEEKESMFKDYTTSSQTEISDEKIEKAKESNWDFMNGTEFELLAWIEGAKWMKERLKLE